ncbi:MAG: class I SAM-dependent methyltransferase family protein [Nocardioidaceae bacterium]
MSTPTRALHCPGGLRVLRAEVAAWLDETHPRPVRVLIFCAGDGRDLIDVLRRRSDADRVEGLLVELDLRNATRARAAVAEAGLRAVAVRVADAGDPASYSDAVPADLVILAGIFGNISDRDIHRVVRSLPMMCARDARVIWTRHRGEPDLTGVIRGWLREVGMAERSFTAPEDLLFSVGVHDFMHAPTGWDPPTRLLTFIR